MIDSIKIKERSKWSGWRHKKGSGEERDKRSKNEKLKPKP